MAGTIAITGATGFVGRHLCRHFALQGWSVRALVRNASRVEVSDNVLAVHGSLEDPESLGRLVQGADAVVHCAGVIKAASRDAFFSVNERATGQFASICAASDSCTRFVLISSLAARLPEISDYAASKRAGELEVEARAAQLDWTILRPPVIYGPEDRESLKLFQLMKYGVALVPGSLDARVSMIYIDDLCTAVERAVASDDITGHNLEVHDGTENGYSWPEVADAAGQYFGRRVRSVMVPRAVLWPFAVANQGIGKLIGAAPMVTPGKLREMYHLDWACRSNPLSQVTNWKPTVTILEGLKRSCIWYEREGWF